MALPLPHKRTLPAEVADHPPKRRRKYTEDDLKLAAIYENLASEVGNDRIAAAKQLVARLAPDNSPTPEQVDTVLTRLIRGLCSSRKAARFGFFVALTEILRQLYAHGPAPPLDRLIASINQKTAVDTEAPNQVHHPFCLLSPLAC